VRLRARLRLFFREDPEPAASRRCVRPHRPSHFRSDYSDRTPLSSGRNRGQVLVENLKRVGGSREGLACPCVREIPGAPIVRPPRGLTGEAQEGRTREAGSSSCGDRSGEAQKSHESIGLCGPRPEASTDLCGEQSPGAAGHRELLVLRAGARDAGNGKRATAPKGVRLHRGETLCRVNPMSGTSPMGWETRGGANRQEGEKPCRRTGSGLEARPAKLFRASAAVGATNPMRAVEPFEVSAGLIRFG
jgi:hypothetical protein